MKKKTYLYKPECSDVVYSNLKAAVIDAYARMREEVKEKISSPYVIKEEGGYSVMVFIRGNAGMYRAHIDVFTPKATHSSTIKHIKIHNIRTDKDGWDNDCDYCCDECPNTDCEDRWLYDEDEEQGAD